MKSIWRLPKALQHLIEKRAGHDRRTSDRRKRLSLLFQFFLTRDRRRKKRRVSSRRSSA